MMERKLTFFTSDWHLGHENSIKFDNRPFDDIDHMERVLINNFNSTVTKDSITYFLGDMGFSKGGSLKRTIDKLNGTKILILGNHDSGHNAMYSNGFDVVMNTAMLWIAGHPVTLSHCPLRGLYRENTEGMKGALPGENWHGEHKHERFSVQDFGQFHLHGHTHAPKKDKSDKILGKQFDVGVVGNQYRPVSISQIESWIAKYGR